MMSDDYIPEAVRQLRLCGAFQGYATPLINCIEVTFAPLFYMEDDEETKTTVMKLESDGDKCCIVLNPDKTEAVVLSIDHKLIDSHKGGIADGAVFNTKVFHFVEFKTNALGNSVKAVTDTYETAINQLHETLKVFTEKMNNVHVDFESTTEIECHVIVSQTFPRLSSTEMTYSMLFAKHNNGIPLSFDGTVHL